jgi:hypothetical protein
MINPGLPDSLWTELGGRLWHATSLEGLTGIVADSRIRVSTGDRYRNSICRCRECVSLFDFGREALDQDDFMRSNWFSWLGSEHTGRCAIWLEIDRERSAEWLIGPIALREIVRKEQLRGRFFVGVEACHKGPIATSAIVGALILDRHDCSQFRRYAGEVAGLLHAAVSFSDSLPPPPPESLFVRALREAGNRHNP